MATGSAESNEVARLRALEEHKAQLAVILDSVKLAVIGVDETQTIVLFNAEAEAIFRCLAAQALGGPLERFIPVSARAIHRVHIENYQGNSMHGAAPVVRTMGGDRILTGLRADGEEFPIDASITRTEVAGRKLFTVILRDVTERIHEQEMLRFQADIINSSAQAILSRRSDGTIVSWNQAAARIFGYTPEEAIGRNINLLYPSAAPNNQVGLAQRAMHGEPVIDFPTKRRRKDGSEVDVEVTISPIKRYDGTVAGTSAIYSDITERKRMEAELHRLLHEHQRAEVQVRESRDRLRELSSALQTIREEEKTRIARELHDELGQALTALKMDAAAIAGELDSAQESVRKRADGMKQLIDATVASVRRIAADLRPVMLDNLGLVPTLEWLTQEVSSRSGIRITLDIPDENLGVGGDAATAIFRIVQEALTNVVRHSGANEVAVEVVHDEGTVVVRVGDNGKGMAVQDAHKLRSFGLLGMRERAFVLGGELKVTRAPQGGTLIEAVIPAFGTTVDGGSS
jgi:PAS domain S-box-containing protein